MVDFLPHRYEYCILLSIQTKKKKGSDKPDYTMSLTQIKLFTTSMMRCLLLRHINFLADQWRLYSVASYNAICPLALYVSVNNKHILKGTPLESNEHICSILVVRVKLASFGGLRIISTYSRELRFSNNRILCRCFLPI